MCSDILNDVIRWGITYYVSYTPGLRPKKTTQRQDVFPTMLVGLDGEGEGVAAVELSIACSQAWSVASDSMVSEK